MKTVLNLTFLSILSFAFTQVNSNSQCDPYNALWAFGEENVRYLRYVSIVNGFDSADVGYRIGEFRIINDSNELRLHFIADIKASECIQGDSLMIEDKTFIPYTKTETFILTDTFKIKFFRELYARRPCYELPPSGPKNGGYGDWSDKHWVVGQGNILDLSEFVVQLVRKSDSTVLFNIDSVGVAPNPYSIYAQRYGTEPNKMNHTREFNTGMGGTECYLQVSPRRNGTTPYGMTLSIRPSDFSYSNFLEYDSTNMIYKCGPEHKHLLDSIFSAKLLFYLDSVKNATGLLPKWNHIGISDSLLDVITELYYRRDSLTVGDTTIYFWTEITESPYPKRGDNFELYHRISTDYYIKQITPMPIINNKCSIEIYAENNLNNASLHLLTTFGSPISQVWKGNLNKGENYINLDLTDFYNGTYILVLRNASGTNLFQNKIIISR